MNDEKALIEEFQHTKYFWYVYYKFSKTNKQKKSQPKTGGTLRYLTYMKTQNSHYPPFDRICHELNRDMGEKQKCLQKVIN